MPLLHVLMPATKVSSGSGSTTTAADPLSGALLPLLLPSAPSVRARTSQKAGVSVTEALMPFTPTPTPTLLLLGPLQKERAEKNGWES